MRDWQHCNLLYFRHISELSFVFMQWDEIKSFGPTCVTKTNGLIGVILKLSCQSWGRAFLLCESWNAPFNAILFFCRRPANKTLQVKASETDRSCAQSKSAASDVQTMRCVYDERHNVSESAAYCVCESQRVWCVLVETLQKRLNRSRCPLAGRQNCVDPWEPCIKQNAHWQWHHLAYTTDWSMRRRRCGLSLPLM